MAAAGGADRRSAKNADRPMDQSCAKRTIRRGRSTPPSGPRHGVPGCYHPAVDRTGLRAWVELYERAWRMPGTEMLSDLFAPEATYQTAPFEEPLRGLPAIAAMWEVGQGDKVFTMGSEVVAVEGDTGVMRVVVRYGDPVRQEYRDLWVVRLDAAGRCIAFEEWPFWPRGTRGGWHEGPPP
jgi:SnoaL-like domain